MKNDLLFIKRTVENVTGIEDIATKSRKFDESMARWIYIKIARENTTSPLKAIGEVINRDHTTVLHGVKNIDFELSYNSDLQTKYDRALIISLSKLNTQNIEQIDQRISELKSELFKLEVKRKSILNEFIDAKQQNQKDGQVFWS
jgi:DNA-binding transcriptional MerR regulator